MQSTLKLELNYHDRSDRMRSIMKSREENHMTDRIGVISKEYNT